MKLFTTPSGITISIEHITIVYPLYQVGDYGWDYMINLVGGKEIRVYFSGINSKEEANQSRTYLIKLMEECK